jgi:glycerol-3-phosphate acyltransferase PlsY
VSGAAPRWARRPSHVIPLLALPSCLWRWAVAFGFPMGLLTSSGELDVMRGWSAVYVAFVSLLTEAVALTAFGLVRPLGEEVPLWLPFFGGRSVRPRVVVAVAAAGSVALMLIWTVGFWPVWTTGQPSPMASSFWAAVFTACYAPLNLWGPALLTLTWAYRRRTSASGSDRAVGHGESAADPVTARVS